MWEWLPGFGGVDDTIFALHWEPTSTSTVHEGNLYFGGSFTNYPSVAVWVNSLHKVRGRGRGGRGGG